MKENFLNIQQNFSRINIKLLFIYIFITIIGIIKSKTNSKTKEESSKTTTPKKITYSEENIFKRLNRTNTENEAINILNEIIYVNQTFNNTNILSLVSRKNWLTASKLIVDFLIEKENPNSKSEEISKNITTLIESTIEKLGDIRSFLKGKKKKHSKNFPCFRMESR